MIMIKKLIKIIKVIVKREMKVFGENVFSTPVGDFGVSGSEEGYTLNYSVDGKTWAAWPEETPANEPLFVVDSPKFMKYKLVGNNSEVDVRW